jgi:hypothetical protein
LEVGEGVGDDGPDADEVLVGAELLGVDVADQIIVGWGGALGVALDAGGPADQGAGFDIAQQGPTGGRPQEPGWGAGSTAIGVTLLLIVLSFVRVSKSHKLDMGRRYGRLLGFAAVVGLCFTVAVAYGVQTLQSGRRAVGTNGRSVESFCDNLGVGAGTKAVDEAAAPVEGALPPSSTGQAG